MIPFVVPSIYFFDEWFWFMNIVCTDNISSKLVIYFRCKNIISLTNTGCYMWSAVLTHTGYPIKYEHGFVMNCFVMVIISILLWSMWSSYPYISTLCHWHWNSHMAAHVTVKLPWRIWVNTNGATTQYSMNRVYRDLLLIKSNEITPSLCITFIGHCIKDSILHDILVNLNGSYSYRHLTGMGRYICNHG